MKLLIVESPTKAKTIRKFLKGYYIFPTYGHLLDLPVNEFGIYLKNGQITAKYVTIKGKKRLIEKIKNLASKAQEIILATDPDREGEMIAYEIKMILPETEHHKIKRIFIHEIIPSAIFQALKNLEDIKESLVNAQKGRRYLDRIFGYTLSPELWKIQKGLSAGRVQSAALKIIVEREREIRNFKKEEYFNIYLILENFPLKVVLVDEKLNVLKIKKEDLEEIKKKILKIKELELIKIIKEKKKIYPPLPLDTENLQRFAFQFLRFPPKKTMFLAQKLFELGYITYHRTDSHFINKNFSLKIKDFIEKNYGQEYFSFPKSKKEKISFEAHEAIRPTKLEKLNLTNDFLKLWNLIFMITISSHFKPLEYLETKYIFTFNADQCGFTTRINADNGNDADLCGLNTLINADENNVDENVNNKLLYEDLTYKIRSAAFKVFNNIGPGHNEKIYSKALEKEFRNFNLSFDKEKTIKLFYQEEQIGTYRPDFIVENKIVVEVKTLPYLNKGIKKQIWRYLKSSEYRLALLINFSPKKLEIERIIYDKKRDNQLIRINPRLDPHESAYNRLYFLAINKELIFDGFAKVFPVKEKDIRDNSRIDSRKFAFKEKEKFLVSDLEIKKIETKPPSRFNEASLIKKLKELGIGRPSTYVPILEILKKRNYVIKEKRFLKPTELGEKVHHYLNQNFPELIDLKFTATMERNLDKIALNLLDYQKFVIDFWQKLGFSS